ncbi:MAG: glycosyltransferase family 2 protein [Bacteroidetes bacterium]|nr:glycosyltransferase family 2 protein [Bacteroidota bacterium]MCK6611229.1 glycosyltransferase family 2 protein [Bacteroidia bacterium]
MNESIELSVVMPCLNEAETLGTCIKKANSWLQANGVAGEVVIGDNGSTDGSQAIAESLGARVIPVPRKGYGAALMGAIEAARGKYVIMGDSDDSYDFSNLGPFLEQLRKGHDLVMGNRFLGGVAPGAMPFLHKYLGNPVLSFIGRLFFNCPVRDFHCGLRGFRQDIVSLVDLKTTGMEFASEMVVKSTLFGLKITEVPTTLSKDGRSRPPHLRTWRDGWRHLRFLLIYSPRWLFLYPGLFLMVLGLVLGLLVIQGPLGLFEQVYFDTNTLLYAGAFTVVGFQALSFGVFTRTYAVEAGFLPAKDSLERLIAKFSLETGLLIGLFLFLAGLGGTFYSLFVWEESNFGQLDYPRILRIVIPSAISIIIGMQTVLSSFFLGVLSVNKK